MRPPDLTGAFGKAWNCQAKSHATSVAHWLLHSPNAHPLWAYYAVTAVHLRDVEGVPPPKRNFPEAEHELLVLALDPKHTPDPDKAEGGWRFLMGPNLVEQFAGLSDDQAMKLTELLVRSFVDGISSPDDDYRSRNRELVRNTVEHMALGAHPVGAPS